MVKRVVRVIVWVIGAYFVLRAVAEPFLIDLSDPSSYRNDWGGPSLPGVLIVHCVPGLIAAGTMTAAIMRHRTKRHRRST